MGTATMTAMVLMRMAIVAMVVVTVIVVMIMIGKVICDCSDGDGHDDGHHGGDDDGDRNGCGDDYDHGLGHGRDGDNRAVVVIVRMVMVDHSGSRSTTCLQEIGAPVSHGVPASLKIATVCSIHEAYGPHEPYSLVMPPPLS